MKGSTEESAAKGRPRSQITRTSLVGQGLSPPAGMGDGGSVSGLGSRAAEWISHSYSLKLVCPGARSQQREKPP